MVLVQVDKSQGSIRQNYKVEGKKITKEVMGE
jgi:hypothetical protein